MKFSDIREELIKALEKKAVSKKDEPEGLTLVEGFILIRVKQEIQLPIDDFNVGGPFILTIAVIGHSTGRVYTYAVKALLPNWKELGL